MGCSHIHVWWIKNWEGYLGRKEAQSHTRSHSPEFQFQEYIPTTSSCKNQHGCVGGRNAGAPSSSSWRTYIWTILLKFTTSELHYQCSNFKMHQVAYRQKLKCLASRQAEATVPSLNPPSAELSSCAMSESLSTWLTKFAPPWRSPETLPHTTYGTTQDTLPYECLVWAHASQLPKS